MFERFTDRARRVVVMAQDEARSLRHGYIGTEHILLALVGEGEGVAAQALKQVGVTPEQVRSRIQEVLGVGPEGQMASGHIPFTPRAKKVLELGLREALQLGHSYIGTEHLLLGLIREDEGVAAQILEHYDVTLTKTREVVMGLLVDYGAADRGDLVAEGEVLTPNEHRVLTLTRRLANAIGKAVPEGANRSRDIDELVAHIHPIQHAFMAQAAARAHPSEFRLLGKSLGEDL